MDWDRARTNRLEIREVTLIRRCSCAPSSRTFFAPLPAARVGSHWQAFYDPAGQGVKIDSDAVSSDDVYLTRSAGVPPESQERLRIDRTGVGCYIRRETSTTAA
jgi:hypothetical protein